MGRLINLIVIAYLLVGCSSGTSSLGRGSLPPSTFSYVDPHIGQPGPNPTHWIHYAPFTNHADDIVSGPDGNLWFTDSNSLQIGRLSPSGTLTLFNLPTQTVIPANIISGRNNDLWFIENPSGIARITTSGIISEYTDPITRWQHDDLAMGPDGNIWVTVDDHNGQTAVEKVSQTGTFLKTYLLGTINYYLWITGGPDGNLWIAESYANKIARLTTHGSFTEFQQLKGTPQQITKGPDGNIWFGESAASADYLGRITPLGVITEFPIPIACSNCGMFGITVGPDKNIWWTEVISQDIGYTTTTGVSKVLIPAFGGQPFFITGAADRNVWFTLSSSIAIYVRLEMSVVPSVVNFQQIGDSQTVKVSEKKYDGSWSASSSNNAVASVVNGGSPNTFTITAVGSGSATITVADSRQNSFPVSVTVP